MLELFRGCIRGCRFCQAGYVYRPVRNRSRELCARYGVEACNDSGYQEVTLSSLSTSDYPAADGAVRPAGALLPAAARESVPAQSAGG